jgi:2-aminoethylphosphonate transport system ATP-binding protein
MTQPAAGVEIEGLTVRFGPKTVLSDLDLTIAPGEFLTVLGRSGCGKTTLLRFVAGFTQAVSGRLRIGGKDLTGAPPHKRNLGLLFQNYALFPHMSVFDNVAFGLTARGVPASQIRMRVEAALRLVQMEASLRLPPASLSGGMQQRVALARALVIEPDVLLLDEPLSALDANLRASVRTELKALHERLPYLSIICVTHDQEDAMVLSDRTLLMREGRIAQLGTPQELYDTPRDRFVAGYFGAANFLPTSLVPRINGHDANHMICLRPEQMRLAPLGGGVLEGTVSNIEWRGASIALSVVPDGVPADPILIALPRGETVPERGARTGIVFRHEDAVLVGV